MWNKPSNVFCMSWIRNWGNYKRGNKRWEDGWFSPLLRITFCVEFLSQTPPSILPENSTNASRYDCNTISTGVSRLVRDVYGGWESLYSLHFYSNFLLEGWQHVAALHSFAYLSPSPPVMGGELSVPSLKAYACLSPAFIRLLFSFFSCLFFGLSAYMTTTS